MTMPAVAHALSAVMALDDGDQRTALAHLATAQRHARTSGRRERQIVEIAGLFVTGTRDRAAGLALVHRAEFPEDFGLLARVTGSGP